MNPITIMMSLAAAPNKHEATQKPDQRLALAPTMGPEKQDLGRYHLNPGHREVR